MVLHLGRRQTGAFFTASPEDATIVNIDCKMPHCRDPSIYTEWAGGRQPLAWQKALPENQQETRWRSRAAIGTTRTSDSQLTLRLEGHYNGSADNKKAADQLSRIPPAVLNPVDLTDKMPDIMTSRKSVLFQVYQKDIIDNYDVNLILQRDLQQHKNMGFAEIRRHFGSADVAVQWQKNLCTERKRRV